MARRHRMSIFPFAVATVATLLTVLVRQTTCYAFSSTSDNPPLYDYDRKVAVGGIRYRARVAYDGTGFSGWQYQSKGRTVQGELEAVLSRRFNRPVRVVGAGRTDTGVHARGQAFQFELLENEINTDEEIQMLQCSLNNMLRKDTRVWNLSRAPGTVVKIDEDGNATSFRWHVIFDARQKLYSYRISTAPALDPIQRFNRLHVFETIDTNHLQSVVRHFEGTHDFRAFAGAIEQNAKRSGKAIGTIRTVYKVDVIDEGNDNYRIDFLLKGALYKMVRNMVASALEVCKGRMKESHLLELLHHTNGDFEGTVENKKLQFVREDNPCKPVPPEGLTLERVFYSDDF